MAATTTPAPNRPLAAPVVDAASAPFWKAAGEGVLLIKRCNVCAAAHWYPRAHCPFCFSDDTAWAAAAGQGTIYSVSIMRAAAVPYAMAYVTLDEGVTMLTNIVDCDLEALRIGDRVQVVFKPAEGAAQVPMFRPVDG